MDGWMDGYVVSVVTTYCLVWEDGLRRFLSGFGGAVWSALKWIVPTPSLQNRDLPSL